MGSDSTKRGGTSDRAPVVGVLIVEPHDIVRVGLAYLLGLREDFHVVGEASAGPEGLIVAEHVRPNVAIVEATIPGMDHLALVRRLHHAHPEIRSIVFTGLESPDVVWQGLEAGADSVVYKGSPCSTLLAGIEAVVRGETYVDDFFNPAAFAPLPISRGTGAVSPREREVLQLLADGNSHADAARVLGVSPETVKSHVKNITRKLEARNRAHAITLGFRRALIH